MADRRGVDRRRGDDRQQVRDLRERLGRRRASPRRPRGGRAASSSRGRAGGVVAAAAGGRRSSGSPASVGTRPARRVRVGEQPVLLEHRELVADRRRAGSRARDRRRASSSRRAARSPCRPRRPCAGSALGAARAPLPIVGGGPGRRYSTCELGLGVADDRACRPARRPRARSRRRRSTVATLPVTVISCSGTPMPRNCTLRRSQRVRAARRPRSAPGRPAPSSTARGGCARAGRPAWAKSSSMWIGLKSPDAPA